MNAPSSTPRRPAGAMQGRVCVITGATRGIGRAAALALARLGAEVVVLGRDPLRTSATRDVLRTESGNPRVESLTVDLASLASVRAVAAQIAGRWPAVHVLVNNAGVNSARRATSADGYEMTLAVNHLAPFLFTHLLLPLLRAAAPSRVVNVSSVFERMGRIDFDDVQSERRYDATRAYTQSKLANVLFTYELAERLRATDVTANCVFPGLVGTDLMREHWWFTAPVLRAIWPRVLLTAEQGARPLVHAASSPELERVTGTCFARGGRKASSSRRSRDPALRRRLWDVSAELTGVRGER